MAGLLIDSALHTEPAGAIPWWQTIDGITTGLLMLLVVQAGLSFCQAYCFNSVGERSLADLRRDTYARLIRLPMAFHSQHRVGELSSRMAADLTQVQDTLIGTIPHLLRQVTILVGGVAVILFTSVHLTLVLLSSLPVVIAIAVVFGYSIRKNARLAQDRLAESNVIVEETLQAVAGVKAFTNEAFEESRYRRSLDSFIKAALGGAWPAALLSPSS